MIAVFSEWFAERALLRLASLQSLDGIEPKTINQILEQFAAARSERLSLRINERRIRTYQRVLTHVWELANERYLNSATHKESWLQVMASCNALYQPYWSGYKRSEPEAMVA